MARMERRVRDLILDAVPGSDRRRVLVHTLVALREHLIVSAEGTPHSEC